MTIIDSTDTNTAVTVVSSGSTVSKLNSASLTCATTMTLGWNQNTEVE